MAVAFDEMNGHGGDIRTAYQELSRWLKETPPDALEYRRQEAELLFRRIGITFAVYGDAEAQERLIPFDVIPRILSATEWALLEKGLRQRVRALNGTFKISSRPGSGTTIEVFMPLPQPTQEPAVREAAADPPRLPAPAASAAS